MAQVTTIPKEYELSQMDKIQFWPRNSDFFNIRRWRRVVNKSVNSGFLPWKVGDGTTCIITNKATDECVKWEFCSGKERDRTTCSITDKVVDRSVQCLLFPGKERGGVVQSITNKFEMGDSTAYCSH
jgi:hypothetical protein